jgi:arsenate reductase
MALPDAPDEILLLHNPRCSKSREARELLASHGLAFSERRYLEEPLTRAELDELARRLGLSPRQWVRSGEGAWRAAGLGPASSDDEILDAMARHPILIERPIAVRGRRAVVGRPPDRILALLR